MNRVVVIGNAGLDLRLAVPRLPLPGETLIGADAARALGGKGLNQAVVAARCGVPVRFCAPLGNDAPQADEVERGLAAELFEQLLLPRLAHPTEFSLLMVLPGGENSIVSTSACSLALTHAEAEPALSEVGPGDVVLLQGNLALDVTGAVLATAQRAGATTVQEPGRADAAAGRVAGQGRERELAEPGADHLPGARQLPDRHAAGRAGDHRL
jgi:ribokinase